MLHLGHFPMLAFPLPSNEVYESTLMVLRTLTEPLGNKRVERHCSLPVPFLRRIIPQEGHTFHPVLLINVNHSEIISLTSQGKSIPWSLC